MRWILAALFCHFFVMAQNSSALWHEEEDKRVNTPVPFTLADRDRILKLEIEVVKLREEMLLRFEAMERNNEARYDNQQQQINDIRNWQYVILAVIVGQFAYLLWDRRSFLKPLEKIVQKLIQDTEDIKNNQEKFDKLINALKELAQTDEKVKNVLQKFHLL